ncbi:choice-of-anchor L domain-containing protein [Planktotalea sp.]|uniref:choice-of-anchor L domain-containing protein n=1 Tax=Planktotalea sp. TaxID=2029877 RepID=UPI0025D8843A|nr:choice-of-anchor L domain-containing protein [Planktotalea sp.]
MPATGAGLGYNTSASAMAMANAIFGAGVTVPSASYTGDNRSSAIYSNGDALSPDATLGDTGVILSTGRADRFTQSNGFNKYLNEYQRTKQRFRFQCRCWCEYL